MDQLTQIVDKSVKSVLDPSKPKKVEEPTHPEIAKRDIKIKQLV